MLTGGSLLGVHLAAVAEGAPAAAERPDHAGPAHDQGPSATAAPRLRASGDRLLMDCRAGVLELLVVQPPGGRAMDAASYLRGHRVSEA